MKPTRNYGGDENVGWRSYTKASPTSNVQSPHICFSFQARAPLQQSKLIYRRSKREPSRLPTHFRLIKIVSIYIVANNNIMLSVIRPYTEVEGGKRQGKCATSLYNSPDDLAALTPHATHHGSMACCTQQKENVFQWEIAPLAVKTEYYGKVEKKKKTA